MPFQHKRQTKIYYTYADYASLPEEERCEIIDGVLYMQAAPSRIHQEILMELSRQIANYLAGKPCKVYPALFCVRLPDGDEKSDEDIKTVVEPDISIVCDQSKLDGRGCIGAPDMIVEITSPSSARKDRLEKFYKYERAGVKEYWIVEPEEKLVSVFVQGDNNRYGRPDIYTEGDEIKVSIFPDLVISLKNIF
ncbi:Uma2 family endonuclease [Desulfofundulus thermosubterraneus]|uniref:Endonuclease, Uma2 family (Restriction endonuclease fold) n=1 Tax=Desulfofundulus thermosubterraneus DSM 16057 TaxID=1121432 RepID=A0A1M6CNV7_9FIRM|nr:Uma2 family endonuclease [Desulfofundulus thermosubterraneus]SHI62735.1 Endonuclease, Uma2 family (restriction endonuclease fold) [Desulfofundulus thermosubterraneus DSM 16057]